MPLSKKQFAVIPSLFSDFDNGFVLFKCYNYERLNHKGCFVTHIDTLKGQMVALNIRTILISGKYVSVNTQGNKLCIGSSYMLEEIPCTTNLIFDNILKNLRQDYDKIKWNHKNVTCIGVLRDILKTDSIELIFIACTDTISEQMIELEEARDKVLSFDFLSRLILEKMSIVIDSIAERKGYNRNN